MFFRPRHLSRVSKLLPTDREGKHYNTPSEETARILKALSESQLTITCITVDKHSHSGKYRGIRGNKLYRNVLEELLSISMDEAKTRDVNIFLDSSSFITLDSFRKLAEEIASKEGHNLETCEKVISEQNKCVQIADYVAGTINRRYEDGDEAMYETIENKISIARKY